MGINIKNILGTAANTAGPKLISGGGMSSLAAAAPYAIAAPLAANLTNLVGGSFSNSGNLTRYTPEQLAALKKAAGNIPRKPDPNTPGVTGSTTGAMGQLAAGPWKLGTAGATTPAISPAATSNSDWMNYESSIPSGGFDYGDMVSSSPVKYNAPTRQGPSAQETAHSQNISDMARLMGGQGTSLYNVSNPLYGQAVDYYGKILSGDKGAAAQAIGPEAEAIAELNAGRMKGIENSGARGGARDVALAESGRQATGEIAGLIPKARQNAAKEGSALALQGMGLGTAQQGAATSAYSDLLGKESQDRQFGDQFNQQNAQFGANMDLQQKQLALQEKLGMKGLDLQQMGLALQEKIQQRGLNLQALTSMNSLQLQRELGMMNINLSQQQVDILKQQMKDKKAEAGGQAIGNIGSTLINILPSVLGMFKPGTSTTGVSAPSVGNTYVGL